MVEEVVERLNNKYDKEVVNFVYMNFFKIFTQVLKLNEACVYISNFGYFYLSADLILKRLDKYRKMKLPKEIIEPVEKVLERSMKYPLNKKYDSRSNS